jgi:hypothetical protein
VICATAPALNGKCVTEQHSKKFISETAVSPKICTHRMGIFSARAPTRRGTIFHHAANFRRWNKAPRRVQRDFGPPNRGRPAIGLSYPDMSLVRLALLLPLGPKTYVDSRQRPTAANDGEYRQLVSVCNTSRRAARSSLLR